MENQYIYSITEAYSMQPNSFWVGEAYIIGHKKDDKGLDRAVQSIIDKIELKLIKIDGDDWQHYVGYDKEGRELFRYRADSVNVQYRYK